MAEKIRTRRKNTTPASALVRYAVKGIEEKKGNEIVCINLKKIPNNACDYFVICEGNSRTQVQAIAGSVEEFVENNTGSRPWHVEGLENGEWVLMDYVDVAVHIFQPEARSHYSLESMWADAEIKKVLPHGAKPIQANREKKRAVKRKTTAKKPKTRAAAKKKNKQKK